MELKKEPSKTLIYVSNLPFDTTDEQFRDLFKGFTVRTAYVARRKNGRSKGFGFANLDKETEQNAAIEKLNGLELSSRKLIAKVAMNDDRRNEKGELKEEFKSQLPPRSTPSETVAHVSNLEWTVNDEELRKIFAEFNPKVATVATRRNGRSKGYGFVEFNSKDELEKAVKLNGTTVSGRQITVQVSVKRTSTPNNNRDNNNRRPNRNSTRRTGGNNNNNNRDNNRGGNNRNNNNNNRDSNRGGNNNNFNVVRRTERRSENTLYISNLPFELDDNDLKQIFQEFQPKNAQIPLRRNGKSRGYGFVEFSNAKDQNAALTALDQSEVNGRVVTIKVSSPNANRDNNNNRDNNRVTVNRRNNNNNRGNNNRDNNRDNNRGNNRGGNNNNNNNNNRGNNNRDNNRNNNNNNRGGNNNNNNRRQPRENRPPRENREVSTNLVYVSNLPFNLEDNGLGEIFKGLKVNKAYVARRRNGYSKGFGFVEFATTEDQQNALKQNGSEVSGRPIVVQAAFKVDEKTN